MASALPETCLVTGVAGFIGSHLAERLLSEGYSVVGVDCFTPSYSRERKEANLAPLQRTPGFRFLEADLATMDLDVLLKGVAYLFHQAGQASTWTSWGENFPSYVRLNIQVTQRLLEAARRAEGLRKLIFASSSSIYGDSSDLPLRETSPLQPVSPYGVTKAAAEFLVRLYARNLVPTVCLRYFSVYGPRQRPDMVFYRFLDAIYASRPVEIYGDGEQTRDFTFVADIVQANLLAMTHGEPGSCFNIGGGSRASLNRCLAMLRHISGRDPQVVYRQPQHGDVRNTWADTTAARTVLGFRPRVSLESGLQTEDEWFRTVVLRGSPDSAKVSGGSRA
jgi:nucleoside-diphosphate-sugar epimerase